MSDIVIEVEGEELHPDLFDFIDYVNGEPHVRHFLIWSYEPVDPDGISFSNTLVNQSFIGKRKLYEKYLKKKQYNNIITLLDKHTQIEWFLQHFRMVYNDLGEKRYYKFLRNILVYIDNHDPYRKHYSDLIQIGEDPTLMMSSLEKRQFKKLPDELKIYRGTSSDKKITKRNVKPLFGNSWSIDREISIWFSMKHSPKYRGSKYIILLTYTLPKSEVISYFTDRGENEIFLDYTTIDIDRITIEEIPKNYKLKVKFNTGV